MEDSTTLPVLTTEQKLEFREMQLEFMQLRAQAQETQQKLQAVVKRMNDAILAAAGSTPNLSFNQDNLTFSETVASGPRPVPINEHRD